VDRSVELPEQAARDVRETNVKSFIGKLLKAEKDLAFYPRGNPAVVDAMRQCEDAQSKAIGNRGTISLFVSRDHFFLDNRPLFPAASPERRFAAELFLLGVRRVRFTGEARAPEFERFMEAFHEARGGHISFEAILNVLRERRIKGIELDRISNLEIVDESSLVEEIDLTLERLDDEQEAASDTQAVVNDLYVRIMPGTLDPPRLAKLMENPVRVKEAFGRLARARAGTSGNTVAIEVAARVLRDITTAIEEAPLKERTGLYRTTAELLLNTAQPLRTQLLMEKILPHVTGDSHEGALLQSLTDKELVELLAMHVPLHQGTVSVIAKSFRNLGLSLPKRQSILSLIKGGASAGGPESERYAALFDALSTVPVSDPMTDRSNGLPSSNTEYEMPGAEAIELTHDETALIEESVKTAGVAATIENMPVLLDLLHLEDDDLRYRSVLDALEAIRNEALKEKNLDAALKVVAGYAREKERRGLDAKETELIRRALERASAQETIMQLVDMSLHLDKSSPEYALILGYLHTLSDRTYYVLLERLEEESSKSLRLAIRGLLIALGKVNMSTLSARVLHKQWFVARNVVSILGEIGGESAVEVLAAAVRHEEPRVRREALNALGKIGGERSAQIIATALEDRDDQVRLCAARWLTTVGDSAPVEALVAIVKSSRFRRMDLETVLLAVRSIAQRDGIVPAQFLEQIARKRITALFGSGKQIAAGAAAALRAKAN